MTKSRHIQLAQNHPCDDSERDLVTYAKLSDPDPWRITKLPNSYWRRLKSIEAAERILAHEAAARSAMVWQEPPCATWVERVLAWFGIGAKVAV
jgi:hypothetical protein